MAKRPTMADVAQEAGVSRALVSIVFREAPGASDATREKVFAAAERIGYRHNSIAARLASQTTQTIGVFIYDMRNDLTAQVFEGLRARADEVGLSLLTGISDPTGHADRAVLNNLMEARVDAIIPIGAVVEGDVFRDIDRAIPVVSATRVVTGVDSVVSDDAVGSGMVVDHLLGLGHERIHMIAPPWRPSARVDGYKQAMTEAGLAPSVIDVPYEPGTTREAARQLLKLKHPPTAIYAHNDVMGLEILDAMLLTGREVPDDMAVAGYDDLRVSASATVNLTTVNQDPDAIGRLAVDMAKERIDGLKGEGRLVQIAPSLVARATTTGELAL